MEPKPDTSVSTVESWLERLYVSADGATLRQEDRRKAREVAAILAEIERMVARFARRSPLVLVDAAAGKSYVGLLAARLVLDPLDRPAHVVTIERDPERVATSQRAVARLAARAPIECRMGEVAEPAAWPEHPSIVVALHACGAAADGIIGRTIESRARALLLVPCSTAVASPPASVAAQQAARLRIPRHAPVRRRFIQALVDAQRTWRLEAAGYETEVVELVPPSVTPHNLLWRARLVGEARRMAAAARALACLDPGGR